MLKKTVLALALVAALAACSDNRAKSLDEERYNSYLTNYQAILDYSDKASSSREFSIQLAVNALDDGTYRYDVIIDDPQVGMFNIKALAVIDDRTGVINTDVMMPSVGILDDQVVNMIPFQSDPDLGYVDGLDLSLVSDQPRLTVSVLVSFNNESGSLNTREYFTLHTEYVPEVTEEAPAEQQQ